MSNPTGGKQPSQAACVSEYLSIAELETSHAGTKPRTSHHRSLEVERCRKRLRRAIVNQMNTGTVSKATMGKSGWSAYGRFRAHRHPVELN